MTDQHGFLLVLLCACVGSVVTQNYNNPWLVFQYCVLKSNIPPVQESDPLLKTIFEITQTNTTVDMLVQCVENNRTRLMNSTNAEEWFVGHVFDPESARQILTEIVGIQGRVNESTCLRTSVPTVTSCLQNVTMVLGTTNSVVKTVENLCSANLMQCMSLAESTCSEGRQLMVAAAKLFYGQCVNSIYTDRMPPFLRESAIFTCGARVYPGQALDMLFPPTVSTVGLIGNVTIAAMVQAESLQIFCSNISQYTRCLKETLTSPRNQADTVLSHILDIDRLPDTFDQYCSNKDLILSQLQCTFEAVKKSRCGGGIVDILMTLNGPLMDTNSLCMRTNADQKCRIRSEFTSCNQEYGSAMSLFYSTLKSETCKAASSRIDMGEFVKCSDKYAAKIYAEEKRMGGSENISGIVSYAMEYVCGVRVEWMQCVRQVAKTSSHPLDKLVLKMMIPANIETILDYSCSMRHELKKHLVCVMGSFGEIGQSQTSCMTINGNKLKEKMVELLKKSAVPSDALSSGISEICAYMTPISKCIEPVFDKCGADLSRYFKKLTGYVQESCGSAKAVALIKNGSARNQATSVLATLMLVMSVIIVL